MFGRLNAFITLTKIMYWNIPFWWPLVRSLDTRECQPNSRIRRGQPPDLREAGCKRIYQETMGGGSLDRPELEKCLDRLEQAIPL